MFARHWTVYFSELKIFEPLEHKSCMKETYIYDHVPRLLPSKKNILSKDSSSSLGREELTDLGCELLPLGLGPHIQHICLYMVVFLLQKVASLVKEQRLTTSKTYHFDWHSNKLG